MANKKAQKKIIKNKLIKKDEEKDFLSLISRSFYPYLIILITGVIVFFQIFSFDMGKLDEDHLITNKIEFLKDFSNFNKAITSDAFWGKETSNFYRPVQNLSFLIDGSFHGGEAWSFYLSNLLIHLITCFALFYLLCLMQLNRKIALALTLFFTLNPLFAFSVAWLPARGDLLIGMFGILGFICLELLLKTKNRLYLFLHLICVFLAIFSKETAIILPFAYLFWLIFVRKQKFDTNLIVLTIAYLLFIVLFVNARSGIASTSNYGRVFGLGGLFSNLQVFPELLGKFFIPYNLAPMPDYNIISTLIGIIFIGILVYFIVKADKKYQMPMLFGLLWFLLFNIPGAMYVHEYKNAAYAYLEHRAYLPLVGIFLIPAFFLNSESNKKYLQNTSVFIIGISMIYGIIDLAGLKDYKTPLDYYNLAIEKHPGSAIAYYNRGIMLSKLNRPEESFSDYTTAITIKSDYAEPYVNRGVFLLRAGNTDDALRDFETSLKIKPAQAETEYNIAQIKNMQKKHDEALSHCTKAISLNPELFDPHLLLGNIYFSKGDFKNAVLSYNETVAIRPQDPGAYNNRGSANFLAGNPQAAIKDFDMAVTLKPDYADAYKNRGMAKQSLNDMAGAAADFAKSASLGNQEADNLLKQIK